MANYDTRIAYGGTLFANQRIEATSARTAAQRAFENAHETATKPESTIPRARNVADQGRPAPEDFRAFTMGDGFGHEAGTIYVREVV